MWIVKVGEKPVAFIGKDKMVLDQKLAMVLEPCLLAYNVTIFLGVEERVGPVVGYRMQHPDPDAAATAVKRCIAFVLHAPAVVEPGEKYYRLVPVEKREREREKGESGVVEFEEV